MYAITKRETAYQQQPSWGHSAWQPQVGASSSQQEAGLIISLITDMQVYCCVNTKCFLKLRRLAPHRQLNFMLFSSIKGSPAMFIWTSYPLVPLMRFCFRLQTKGRCFVFVKLKFAAIPKADFQCKNVHAVRTNSISKHIIVLSFETHQMFELKMQRDECTKRKLYRKKSCLIKHMQWWPERAASQGASEKVAKARLLWAPKSCRSCVHAGTRRPPTSQARRRSQVQFFI